MMTKGGKGTRNPFIKEESLEKIREQETYNRYSLLNNITLTFAGFKDGKVTVDDYSISKIENLLLSINPKIIYIPEYESKWAMWKHTDHINSSKIILQAIKRLNQSIMIRCYHSTQVNFFVNMTSHFHENCRAIRFYKSQDGFFAPNLFLLSRLTWFYNRKRRQWGKMVGCKYAEGFRQIVIK
jgi:LmbE family N-acetylglucosaminyl deacetylase